MNKDQRTFLEEHGWVVIPNVVEAKDCDEFSRQLFSFLQSYNAKLKLDQPDSWTTENLPPGTLHGGMNRCAGHLQALWDIRQHPKVAQVFADLYGVDPTELVTSMDAWTVWNSKAITPKMREKRWLHFDQGPQAMPLWPGESSETETETKEEKDEPTTFKCVQGYVTLEHADTEDDGGLFLVDKGHKLHAPYFQARPELSKTGNWHMLPPKFLASLDPKEYPQIPVLAKKGSVVLWYSTTPHQGRAPTPKGRNRAVVYVCQAPKALLSEQDTKARKEAWQKGIMTCHWPVLHVRHFKHQSLTPTSKVELTALGQSLLGFEVGTDINSVDRSSSSSNCRSDVSKKDKKKERKQARARANCKNSRTGLGMQADSVFGVPYIL